MQDLTKPSLFNVKVSKDKRGSFVSLLKSIPFEFNINQINISKNILKGTVRGMHYQNFPKNECKYLLCLTGSLYDVLIDIRSKSINFLKKYEFMIDSNQPTLLFIPKGFAHGFQTLEDNTNIIYLHEESYFKELSCRVNPMDPKLNIKWPLSISVLSEEDECAPYLKDSFDGI